MKTIGASLLLLVLAPSIAHAQTIAPAATADTHPSATPTAPAQTPAQSPWIGPAHPPIYPQASEWSEPTLVRRRGPQRVTAYRGGPIPMGMHLETRRLHGLVVGGAIVFGVSYLASTLTVAACSGLVTTSCTQGMGWMLVPAAGPFVALGFAQTTESRALLVIDGLLQGAGLAMMAAAFLTTRTVLVDDPYAARTHRPQWSFVPAGPAGSTGVTVTLTNF